MALAKKVCRVCGKPYEACRSAKKDVGVFVWQEVACSEECGRIYLSQILASRTPAPAVEAKASREWINGIKDGGEISGDVLLSETAASDSDMVD